MYNWTPHTRKYEARTIISKKSNTPLRARNPSPNKTTPKKTIFIILFFNELIILILYHTISYFVKSKPELNTRALNFVRVGYGTRLEPVLVEYGKQKLPG